jgi:SAM-dependent methyltransferase
MAVEDVAALWDVESDVFDDEPHHSLHDPTLRDAWWDVLESVLPPPPAVVADLGCGTGSLSAVAAEMGYDVIGIDVSARMLERARAKAERYGVRPRFAVGDAATPALAPGTLDVVLTRHVVWALDDPAAAIDGWFRLLAPRGTLVLVEGLWHTGSGMTSDDLARLVDRPGVEIDVVPLDDPLLWGHPIHDSRYVLTATT